MMNQSELQEALEKGEWVPCVKKPVVVHVRKQAIGDEHVSTREGLTPVKPDDLIMQGINGEQYPIGREIFEKTYSLGDTLAYPIEVSLTDDEIANALGWLSAEAMNKQSTYGSDIYDDVRSANKLYLEKLIKHLKE